MSSNADRFKGALGDFVRSLFARIDYLALYKAQVISQNGDGSLELRPDDARLPGMSRVPMRTGVPGVEAKVTPGTSVMLGFAGGDPTMPFAGLFEKSSLQSITITAATKVSITSSVEVTVNAPSIALGTGGKPVARVGDPVVVLSPGVPTVLEVGTPMPGVISAGNPQVRA